MVSCGKSNQLGRGVQPLAGERAEQTGENRDFTGEPVAKKLFRFLQCGHRQ